MKILKLRNIFALILCIISSNTGHAQGNTFHSGQGNKFMNHPDANIYNAYNMLDFSWWNHRTFNEQFYEVAKVKYLESYRLMGRIEATKTTLLAVRNEKKQNVHCTSGKDQQNLLLEIMTLENLYAEDNMLQQELLVYQQECGRNIMNYTSTYHYNQAEGIIKSLMLNSRSKYELGHADKGSIPARIAKMNQNLRNIIYGSPGQMIYNILDIAGAAVANY